MKKGLILWYAVFLGMAILWVFPSTFYAAEPIGIGYVGPVTWDYGKTQIAGAELAIEEVNKAGGILGRPTKLFICDSELKASGAVNCVHKLVEVNKVEFLVGIYGSEEGTGAREAACELKKVAIYSAGATHDWITTTEQNYEKYKYTFRNGTPDEIDVQARYVIDEQIPWMAEIIKKKLGIQKLNLAILTDAAKWQDLAHEAYLKEFPQKGYNIVYQSRLSTTATDTSAELTNIKKSGAHIIVGGMAYKSSLPLIRQWNEMKVPAIWAGVNVLAMSPKFWEQTGGKCVYACTYSFGPVHVPITPQTKMMADFLSKKLDTYYHNSGGPYVGIWSLKHAAERAKTLEAGAMIKALLQIQFDSVGGTIKYLPNHSHFYGPVGVGSPLWTKQQQPGGKLAMVHIGPLKSEQRLSDFCDGELMLPPWMIDAGKK